MNSTVPIATDIRTIWVVKQDFKNNFVKLFTRRKTADIRNRLKYDFAELLIYDTTKAVRPENRQFQGSNRKTRKKRNSVKMQHHLIDNFNGKIKKKLKSKTPLIYDTILATDQKSANAQFIFYFYGFAVRWRFFTGTFPVFSQE